MLENRLSLFPVVCLPIRVDSSGLPSPVDVVENRFKRAEERASVFVGERLKRDVVGEPTGWFGCTARGAASAGTDEFLAPIKSPMRLVVSVPTRLGRIARAPAAGVRLAIGVRSVLAGDGVFLLNKLLNREFLPVLIWLLKV
jgi:hypothetical protein